MHTRHRELQFDRVRAPIVNGRGHTEYDLFRARKLRSELLVVMLHGWLGSKTLRHVAQEVANDGFDVALVDQTPRRGLGMLSPNARRSRIGHSVTKHASILTGKPEVIFWDHSNGHRDVTAMIEHQEDKTSDELTYEVKGVAATASVGTNGKTIDLMALPGEIGQTAKLLTQHPREEVRVLGQSLATCAQNPLLAAIEGFGALSYTSSVRTGQLGGVVVQETYLADDYVIRTPDNTEGVFVLDNCSHLSPVVDADIARLSIARLAQVIEVQSSR